MASSGNKFKITGSGTFLVFLFVSLSFTSWSQKKLLIDNTRKRCEIYEGESFSFRAKSHKGWQAKKLVNIHDSLLIFSDESSVVFSQIKCIKYIRPNRLSIAFQKFFFRGGIMFFTLNTANRLIIGDQPVFSSKAAIVSGGLIVCSLLCRQQMIKHIRVNNSTLMRSIDINFQELN